MVHAPQNLDANSFFQPCGSFSFHDAKCGQGRGIISPDATVYLHPFSSLDTLSPSRPAAPRPCIGNAEFYLVFFMKYNISITCMMVSYMNILQNFSEIQTSNESQDRLKDRKMSSCIISSQKQLRHFFFVLQK
jgi:hypothetical protein